MDAVQRFFTENELKAIRAAVSDAEGKTSGEIVPFVIAASDAYSSAVWKGTALGALAGPLVAEAVYLLGDLWGGGMPLWIALPTAAGGAAGFLIASFVPAVKRWLAGGEMLDLRTQQRARRAFLDEEVFRTRDRTGILLFLSLFEHRVVVLGDSGISRQVEQRHWDGIVQAAVGGIRDGRPGEALVQAIHQCGELLERYGVALQPGDTNELADDLRLGER